MYGYIYLIKNSINQNVYVGKTTNFRQRKTQHLWKLKNNQHENQHLQNSFNKYGRENFAINIVDGAFDEFELNRLEKKWISSIPEKCRYNMTEGGEGIVGYKLSQEQINKMLQNKKYFRGKENFFYIHLEESEIINMYNDGFDLRKIAKINGVSSEKIRNVLKENNVQRRNRRDSRRTGIFGFRGAKFGVRNINPWRKVWESRIGYNNKSIHLGQFCDPLSCEIVYNLVKDELEKF